MQNLTRRSFVQRAFGLAAVAQVAPFQSRLAIKSESPVRAHSVRLGGPVFGDIKDPDELALAHRKLGYRAAYCPNVAVSETERIRGFAQAFAKHDVIIAEVGRWVNLMDADTEKRRQNLKFVTEGLALAEAIGARCCVDIAGSRNATYWYGPHPANMSAEFVDAAVENARKIIDAVKPTRTRFSYEMMGWAVPDSPDAYVKLIKAIDRKAFGVHLDPCNAVNSPERFYRNTALLNECFDKLGRWIVSCHAKDLTWDVEMNVHFREVRPGAGSLDYATYLKRLARLPGDVPLMLEHLPTADEYAQAAAYVRQTGQANGISF